jgi:hypothetical protein
MLDYKNGKIYTIRFYDDNHHIYIGSTVQSLAFRFGGHKNTKNSPVYRLIHSVYNGDFKKCYIELYELCPCSCKKELERREGQLIREFKNNDKYNVLNIRFKMVGMTLQDVMEKYNRNPEEEKRKQDERILFAIENAKILIKAKEEERMIKQKAKDEEYMNKIKAKYLIK